MTFMEPVCRGSYKLGSACGLCPKCQHTLLQTIAELVDERDPCWYDHHGNCQAHNLQERPCPHERAKEILSTAKQRHGFKELTA